MAEKPIRRRDVKPGDVPRKFVYRDSEGWWYRRDDHEYGPYSTKSVAGAALKEERAYVWGVHNKEKECIPFPKKLR